MPGSNHRGSSSSIIGDKNLSGGSGPFTDSIRQLLSLDLKPTEYLPNLRQVIEREQEAPLDPGQNIPQPDKVLPREHLDRKSTR